MAFASVDDVAARLARPLEDGEEAGVEFLLEAATASITASLGKNDAWADAYDPAQFVRYLCVELVCRTLANPQSVQSMQEQLGQFSSTVRFRDTGLLLTPLEELVVRRIVFSRTSGSSGELESVATEVHDYLYGS